MSKENKKKILIAVACILTLVGTLCRIYFPDNEINNTVKEVQNIVENEIDKIDENVIVQDITENQENSSTENTIEDINITIEDEELLEEEELEDESFELQGEIAYEGDRARSWNVELGNYQGLTYYSQIDTRWKNIMYSSVGDGSQTIGSSGCGPTSAAMVVSSIKGTITPDTMSSLFVKYGYRSANNGTYWSAYRAIADEFNIGYTETSDIQKALDLLKNNNYVICSVGNGLFTTGGHYIVIVGIEENALKIYDPYLYDGKFDTSTRRGKVEVSGNTIYCSIDNFKNYSNYKQFFCYQNENNNKYSAGQRVLVNIPVGVCCYSGNYALVDDWNGQQFWIHKSIVTNDNRVYGLGTVAYDGGQSDIVQIFDEQFWANEKNMSLHIDTPMVQINNTVGQIRKLKQSTIIYSKSNLNGLKFNYKANTTITILDNINSNIDKVKVNVTGRVGYIENKYY